MSRERFVIAECHGARTMAARGGTPHGLSVGVLDRFYCYRIVQAWQSDDVGGNTPVAERLAYAHEQARELADHLNAGGP